ncbi:thiamine phosphate synthase [Leucothrix mucor]|uniref:thiamine phosphate synthase n=1 Tax=Leucothrix mucor TaxID=45248 RepID=UPI0003B69A85|nr:thiamine phosphate synthase [Leucothrix mucor]
MTRPTPQTSNPYQLYLVTDDQQDLATLMHVVAEAVKGGVTMVQLREKHGDIRAFIERANALKAILVGTGVPLIINDRVDVALAVDADGVHLGQSDMPAALARQLIGPDKILGLSIESPQQLAESQQLDLDYIGLSAIFATPTKTNTSMHWGLDGLVDTLQKTALPVVAIGGINQGNIREVAATGVHGIALVSAICHADDPCLAARGIVEAMR